MKKIFCVFLLILFACVLAKINFVYAQSGNSFNAQINIHKEVVNKISPYIWGVNGEALPDMTADAFLSKYPAYRTMGIKMIRYPGGAYADGFDWQNHTAYFYRDGVQVQPVMSVDEVLKLAKILKAEVIYVADVGNTEGYGLECLPQISGPCPDKFDKNIEFFQKYKGQIKYYELGNEPYYWTKPPLSTPNESYPAVKYLETAKKYARRLKEIDPSVKTTLVASQLGDYISVTQSAISLMCGNIPCFDTISIHPYYRSGYISGTVSESNYPGKAAFAVFNVINPYFNYLNTFYKLTSLQPNRSLAVTEYNVQCYGWGKAWNDKPDHSSYIPYGWSQGTVDHGFYMIESLFQMITNNVIIANYHDMIHTQLPYRTGNCGLLEEDNTTMTTAATAFAFSSPAAGGWLLKTDNNSPMFTIPYDTSDGYPPYNISSVSAPYLSAYTVISPNDGLLYVYLINKYNTQNAITTLQFDSNVEGLASANTADITRLNSDSFPDRSFSKSNSMIAFSNPTSITIPAHSIALVKIYNSAPGPFNCNRCSIMHGCERTQFQSAASACLTPNSGVIRTTDCSCPQISGGDNNRCEPACLPTPTPTLTPTPTPLPGDLNGDTHVNDADFQLFIPDFGKTGSPGWIPADIDKNGKVDIFDYNILVGNFGK